MPTSSPRALISAPPELPGIDRRVGLDEILVRRDAEIGTADRRDDAQRHGLTELVRIADGQHPFGDLQLRRVAPRHRRQIRRVHLEQRQVGGRIDADHLGAHLALVRERDRDVELLDASDRLASPVTTWLLVRMYPSRLTMTPEPRLFSTPRREHVTALAKRNSKNGSVGTRWRTICCAEMLTTAGTVRSAMPAEVGQRRAPADRSWATSHRCRRGRRGLGLRLAIGRSRRASGR